MNSHPVPVRLKSARGFTLLEILIALAIVAIGLTAALRATGIGTDGVLEFRTHLLAQWVAENTAVERTARQEWPATGQFEEQVEMAGYPFLLRQTISSTPNPRFRRLEITVASPAEPTRSLRQLTVFLTAPN